MTHLPYRATLGRLLTSSRLNTEEQEALRVALHLIDLTVSPAEAALDGEERGDSPPSTPPTLPSVASADEPLTRQQVRELLAEGRRGRAEIDARIAEMHRPAASDVEKAKAAHPWRRGRAVSVRRVPGGRVE